MKTYTGNDIRSVVEGTDMVLLYFSRPDCGVCDALRPRVDELLQDYPAVDAWFVDLDAHPTLAGEFSIFTIPGVVLFVQGRETVRYARYLSIDQLEESISRYYELLDLDKEII